MKSVKRRKKGAKCVKTFYAGRGEHLWLEGKKKKKKKAKAGGRTDVKQS